MSAPKTACGECGKEVRSEEFHDYVECVRYRTFQAIGMPVDAAQFFRDLESLLAYIDSKESQRVAYRHYLEGAAKFHERPALPPEDSRYDEELFR